MLRCCLQNVQFGRGDGFVHFRMSLLSPPVADPKNPGMEKGESPAKTLSCEGEVVLVPRLGVGLTSVDATCPSCLDRGFCIFWPQMH